MLCLGVQFLYWVPRANSTELAEIQNRKEVKFASILISVFQLSAICERGLLFGLGTLLDSRYKAMPRPEVDWQPGKTGYMLGFMA